MEGDSGEIWSALPPLQPNHPKSDRLLGHRPALAEPVAAFEWLIEKRK